MRRNHLEVAYLNDEAAGCSIVRPPTDDPAAATLIARVLTEHCRRGPGEQIYRRAPATAHELGVQATKTVVLASNEDRLRSPSTMASKRSSGHILSGHMIAFVGPGIA